MSEMTSYEPGTPSWVDMATTDAEGARSFYTGLFGWETEDMPAGESGTYTMCSLHGKPVAAFYEMDEKMRERGVPPMWLTYISVADVEASSGKAKDAGGQLHADPFAVGESGRMALVQDPTGAMFALWEAREHPGAAIVNEAGTMIWNELASDDPDKAGSFYAELLGWDANGEDVGGEPYTTFKAGDKTVGGALPKEALPEGVPSHWTVYFGVDDCDEAVDKAKELGAELMFGPQNLGEIGRMAALKDPQGATFSVITVGSAPEEEGSDSDEKDDKDSKDAKHEKDSDSDEKDESGESDESDDSDEKDDKDSE